MPKLKFDPKEIPNWNSVSLTLKVTTSDKNLMAFMALLYKLKLLNKDGKIVIDEEPNALIEIEPHELYFPQN